MNSNNDSELIGTIYQTGDTAPVDGWYHARKLNKNIYAKKGDKFPEVSTIPYERDIYKYLGKKIP